MVGMERAHRYSCGRWSATACAAVDPWLAGSPLRESPRLASGCNFGPVRTILPKDSFDSNGGPTLETFSNHVEPAGCTTCKKRAGSVKNIR